MIQISEFQQMIELIVNIIVYGGIIALVIAIVEKLTNIFVSMVRGKTRL